MQAEMMNGSEADSLACFNDFSALDAVQDRITAATHMYKLAPQIRPPTGRPDQ